MRRLGAILALAVLLVPASLPAASVARAARPPDPQIAAVSVEWVPEPTVEGIRYCAVVVTAAIDPVLRAGPRVAVHSWVHLKWVDPDYPMPLTWFEVWGTWLHRSATSVTHRMSFGTYGSQYIVADAVRVELVAVGTGTVVSSMEVPTANTCLTAPGA
jgi:hypothetical protein